MTRRIDAHQHFWRIGAQDQPWRDAHQDAIARDFEPADLQPLLDEIGIDATVLVQSVDGSEENDRLARYADEGFVAGVVTWLPVARPSEARRELQRLSPPQQVGVRCLVDDDPLDWLADPEVVGLFRDLAARDLAWDVVPVNGRQVDAIVTLADAVPDLNIVIDHLGRPPVERDGREAWTGHIDRLARRDNISMKVSVGLSVLTSWRQWDGHALAPFVEHAVRRFGADRLMMASNWPVVTLRASYRDAWGALETQLRSVAGESAGAALGGTAARVYGLDRVASRRASRP